MRGRRWRPSRLNAIPFGHSHSGSFHPKTRWRVLATSPPRWWLFKAEGPDCLQLWFSASSSKYLSFKENYIIPLHVKRLDILNSLEIQYRGIIVTLTNVTESSNINFFSNYTYCIVFVYFIIFLSFRLS